MFKQSILALVAASALSGTLLAGSAPAQAHCYGCGEAAAAGIGGLVLGTMIGAAAAQPRYASPTTVEEGPVCYRQRVRVIDTAGVPHRGWRTVCR